MVKELSQKERLAAELMTLNADVTEQDRKEYMKEYKVTRTMLSNYMNGKVANSDRAVGMLVFFRKKIDEREKLINAN